MTPIVVMQRASCCWPTNGMRYVLAALGSVPSVPEFVRAKTELEWATRPDEEETKRSSLFGNFNFVYFKTVVGMLDGISECILFHVLILQIVFI